MEWLVIAGLVVAVVVLWNRVGRLERRLDWFDPAEPGSSTRRRRTRDPPHARVRPCRSAGGARRRRRSADHPESGIRAVVGAAGRERACLPGGRRTSAEPEDERRPPAS